MGKKTFRLNRVAVAAMLASTVAIPQFANAGAGWGDAVTAPGAPGKKVQTFYANSPSGLFPALDCFSATGLAAIPVAGGLCDSGGFVDPVAGSLGMRKFVDTLAGLTVAGANNLGNYIPVATADVTTYPGSDYYEIAVVEYRQKMHSDVAGLGSTLRGYVQIDPAATDTAAGLANGAVSPIPVGGTPAVALFQLDGITPVTISRPDIKSPTGFRSVQAYAVQAPHYLGPVIQATQGRPTRMKYYNALPVGHANALTGQRFGDLFLPVDETLPGSGFGPDGLLKYTQNRSTIHLHGGDNPWISDGTPQQWITPAGEADPLVTGSVAALAAAKPVGAVNVGDYLRAPGAINVPDMPNPGPGAMTYFFPNNQSARMEWYHDHTFGLTRLNVYGGQASAYIVRDAQETALTTGTGVLAGVPEVPLVIQDKTFVPTNIAGQDAKWDTVLWGQPGDLWYPHVYETNQDPMSFNGTNPVGRWDWGPWFWPVFPSAMDLPTGEHKIYAPGTRASWTNATNLAHLTSLGGTFTALPGPSDLGLSEVTTTPEAFNDTPLVNGVAYPTVTLDPRTYRLRILNASNDRMLNLGLYVAHDALSVNTLAPDATAAYTAAVKCDGTEPVGANCSEVKMVPFVGPNSPTTTTFACPTTALPGTQNTTPITPVHPYAFPCDGGLLGTGWGSQDNRPGGVPDPTTMGPSMWLIGNETGLVPAPIEIPSTPINYEYNKRSVTVLNVLEHGVFLGNAERADVVVDLTNYAGQTLILYNDAPAPLPAGDPRLDLYTMGGDQTGAGGAPTTMPGYGPNTRTVMQIKVAAAAAAPAMLDPVALKTQVSAAYAASQAKPIVPQTAYNTAFPALTATDTFARIYTGSIYLNSYIPLAFTTTDTLTFTPAPGTVAAGLTNQAGLAWNGGVNLAQCSTPALCDTVVSASKAAGPATAKAGTAVRAYVESKAIQELFDPTWGRMNATLGVELPFTTALRQTTIPLGYIDPATETLADGETQFWKITHNGVDSHPVHFHLVNVQVVNRMGWDGTIKPALPQEIGWKETIRMNPLEDILVAVRAKKALAPFGVPHSYRAMDTSQPLNVATGFTQVNPITGNPAVVKNTMTDYGNEYVWHCHILGHEENDFMRPVVFNPKDVLPPALGFDTLAATLSVAPAPLSVAVSWTDPTPAAALTTPGNPGNEIGFRVERATVTNGVVGAYTGLAPLQQVNGVNALGAHTTYGVNTLANQTALTDTSLVAPVAPTAPVLSVPAPADITATSVKLTWTGSAANVTGYNVYRNGSLVPLNAALLPAGTTTFTDTTVPQNTSLSYVVEAVGTPGVYSYRVVAVNAVGETITPTARTVTMANTSVKSAPLLVTTTVPAAGALAANLVSATGTVQGSIAANVALSFTNNAIGATGYTVEVCYGACAAAAAPALTAFPANANTAVAGTWYFVNGAYNTTATPVGAATAIVSMAVHTTAPANYTFRVAPRVTGVAATPYSAPVVVDLLGAMPAATTLVGTPTSATTATLTWADAANNNASYTVSRATASKVATVGLSSQGTGYVTAPAVSFPPAPAGAVAPTAVAVLGTGLQAGRVIAVNVTTPGWNYPANSPALQAIFTGGTPTTPAAGAGVLTAGSGFLAFGTAAGNAASIPVTGLVTKTGYLFRVTPNRAPLTGLGLGTATTTTTVMVTP